MVGKLRGGSNLLELRVRLHNEEELKLDIDNTATIHHLKDQIYHKNPLLS